MRDIVTGKKPSGALAVNGTAARKMGGKQRQQLFVFTVQQPSWSNVLISGQPVLACTCASAKIQRAWHILYK